MANNFVTNSDDVKDTKPMLNVRSIRRNMVIMLIASIIAINSVVILSNYENREFFSNWTVNITLVTTIGLALIMMYRQKQSRAHFKSYISIVITLALWFAAERVSTYYELGVGTEASFPSFADLFRLTGYALFSYHLYSSYLLSRKSFIPYWKLLSLSMVINSIAYGGFVYNQMTNITDEIWMWDVLYNTSYLCIATALFWHNRFFIFKKDQEKSGGKVIPKPFIK